jgi:hypothetical protein
MRSAGPLLLRSRCPLHVPHPSPPPATATPAARAPRGRQAKEEIGSMTDYAGGKPLEYFGSSVCGRWEGVSAAGAGIVFERGPDGRYSKSYDNPTFCDNPQYSLTVSSDCDISITVWDVVSSGGRRAAPSAPSSGALQPPPWAAPCFRAMPPA